MGPRVSSPHLVWRLSAGQGLSKGLTRQPRLHPELEKPDLRSILRHWDLPEPAGSCGAVGQELLDSSLSGALTEGGACQKGAKSGGAEPS